MCLTDLLCYENIRMLTPSQLRVRIYRHNFTQQNADMLLNPNLEAVFKNVRIFMSSIRSAVTFSHHFLGLTFACLVDFRIVLIRTLSF